MCRLADMLFILRVTAICEQLFKSIRSFAGALDDKYKKKSIHQLANGRMDFKAPPL